MDSESDMDTDDISDSDLCCVCNKFSPPTLITGHVSKLSHGHSVPNVTIGYICHSVVPKM